MAEISADSSAAVAAPFIQPLPAKRYSYARSHRIAEIFGVFFGSALLALTAWRATRGLASGDSVAALGCLFAGLCLADWASGFVHWAADSYGYPSMPIFGGFVRTFREHHFDQQDITLHDAVETNGDVFIFSSPVHLTVLLFVHNPFWLAVICGVFAGSYCNSQIHKWAHTKQPPALVRTLQRARFFLSPEHHAKHHSGSHESNYCITTGWMNRLLDSTRFFRRAEWALGKVGIPRNN